MIRPGIGLCLVHENLMHLSDKDEQIAAMPLPQPIEKSSHAVRRQRRFWTRMALVPALLAGVALLGSLVPGWGQIFTVLLLYPWVAFFWLIICAANVPPARRGAATLHRILWRAGWFCLFFILHLMIGYGVTLAGCSLDHPR